MGIQHKPELNSMISPGFLDKSVPGEDRQAVGGLTLVLGGRKMPEQMPYLLFNRPFQGKPGLLQHAPGGSSWPPFSVVGAVGSLWVPDAAGASPARDGANQ